MARRLPRLLAQISYISIDVVIVVIESFAHLVARNRRIRQHDRDEADDYCVPLFITGMQDTIAEAGEDIYSHLNSIKIPSPLAKVQPIPEASTSHTIKQLSLSQVSNQIADGTMPSSPNTGT